MMKLSVFLLLLLLETCSAITYENVALRGKATQSDRYEHVFGAADSAIDGNRESNFRSGSCTHTDEETNPWWRVDLLESYIVTSVIITNRGDCCQQRLNGAEVHIGNSLQDNGASNPVAGTVRGAKQLYTLTFTDRVEGRYVSVVLPGRGVLTLCEVEVYGYRAPTGENLALQGKASQSSLYMFGTAYNAIDGNPNSHWEDGSCTHTKNNINPWWRLDLIKTHKVFSVKITNRDEDAERLDGAEIRIGDSLANYGNNNTRCAVITSIPSGGVQRFECNGMDGRYVNIVIPGREEFLSLCEVEVYGSRLDCGSLIDLPGLPAVYTSLSSIPGPPACIRTMGGIWDLGKNFRYIPAHEIAKSLGPDKSKALPVLHAFTGCDIVSIFATMSKRRAWDTWGANDMATEAFMALSKAPKSIREEVIYIVERFPILLYERTSSQLNIDEFGFGFGSFFSLSLNHQTVGVSRMMKLSVFLLLLLLETCSAITYENVALRGKATQSDRYEHAFSAANSAIDGNRESNFHSGSCTHTDEETNPWWRVDLLESYIVTSIIITNRGDCCQQRLNGAEVHIGNSLQDNGAANPVAGTVRGSKQSYTLTFTDRVEGRYVSVVLPGRRYLTLCEVEVYGYRAPTGENLALQGKASQSSLYMFGTAYNAIDGNPNSHWEDGSCTHTKNNINPWWRLDLQKTHKVFSVKITNRDEDAERLNGAEIRIGDSLANYGNNNTRCAVITSIPSGGVQEFECNGMDGRYVNIVIPRREEFLSLCEVEVYGSRLDMTTNLDQLKRRVIHMHGSFKLWLQSWTSLDICSKQESGIMKHSVVFLLLLVSGTCSVYTYGVNLALTGYASQSSTYSSAVASRAINGKKTCLWNDGSLSHTNGDLNPWWRLDLRKTHKVFSVYITNRADAVPERINGAEIRIGDDLGNHVSNPRCASITSIPAGATVEFQCSGGMDGRYVTIVVPGREEYLTLCEVEVYGYRLPTGVNLALHGDASQSSTYSSGVASRAINGKKTCLWNDGSLSHTNGDLNPWWRLDLRNTHKVFSVNITNRADAVPERINGAEIRIGDDLVNHVSNPRCASITSIPAGATVEFQCSGGMDGRYVTIVVPGRQEYLTLCEVEVYGYRLPTGVNLALTGDASQSSTYSSGVASRAINGKKTCLWNDGSLSHTNGDLNPWWRLDLRNTHKVFSVNITNRADAVPKRINGAEIRIGDDLGNHVSNPRCALITSIPAGATVEFQCSGGMDGRYVTIVVPGREEYLTLCEVEVYGYRLPTGVNLALTGDASQSSTYSSGVASRAINGKKTCLWNDGSLSHTNGDLNPWWRLDLRKTHKVFSVYITNRADAVPERINGAEIRIGDDLGNHVSNPRCASITSIPAGATVEFQCSGGMDGRYVTIVVPGREEYLTLCEVEVYGYRLPTGVNLALTGDASQSSTYSSGVASNAINGKKTCLWNDGSLSHTNGDLNPWWRLDLRNTHKVFSVYITNRADAVPKRINGAEIRIGDDLVNHVSNPRCALITSIPAGATVEFQCSGGMDGRYVTIVVPGRQEYLTLCEVEVYGYRLPTGVL
ncbi:uncharacterized protein LOC141779820 [Sebastes fasciatus]|uniref:uncharacterized protein LOC141779820 n=1 Tax=Sebastes fasciatus TaxID=394691 RepID=UPI003D9F1927